MKDAASTWFFDTVESTALAADERPVALVQRSARAGAMAPLHRRPEDESYRVLDGHVTFYVDGEEIAAGPGDVVVARGDATRTFRVESTEAHWLVLTRVDSLARFEDFGRAVSEPAESWASADELASLRAIAAANRIEILGPPGLVPLAA